MKNRVLILKSDNDDFEKVFIKGFRQAGIDCHPIYKKTGRAGYYLRVLWNQYLNLPYKSLTYGDWKDTLDQYDTVILFDRILSWDILKFIKRKNPHLRLIAWYWNPVDGSISLPDPSYGAEVWSFNPTDCAVHSLKFNTQFYFQASNSNFQKSGALKAESGHPEKLSGKPVAFFAGVDKGRAKEIIHLGDCLKKADAKLDFSIISDKNSSADPESSSCYRSEKMAYGEILDRIRKADLLVDVPQAGQNGLTLRVLEAQFYHKKLLTTNPSVKDCCFYHPANILIMQEKTTLSELETFLHLPCNTESFEKADYYSIPNWLERFNEGAV